MLVIAVVETDNAVPRAKISATLIIAFGKSTPDFMAGHMVVWRQEGSSWTYTVSTHSNTTYEFLNVSVSTDNVWSLMLASSAIMNATTGKGLSFEYTYYPEYQDYLITSIAGVQNGNGSYWQYMVNGRIAAFGVLHEKITQGNVVSWFFGPYG